MDSLVGWFTLEIFHEQASKPRQKIVVVGEVLPPDEHPLDEIKMGTIDMTRDEILEKVDGEFAGLSYGDIKPCAPAWTSKAPITSPAIPWLQIWAVREE